MQHNDCGNNAEQTEQGIEWSKESETDAIVKLVILPELTPAGNASGQCANGNKQQRSQNEPAKDDSHQPGCVAGMQSKEETNGCNATKHC